MNPDDLLKLLDLDRPPPATSTTPTAGILAEPEPVPADASQTALVVDAWGLRRGRDLLEDSDRLRAVGTDALAAADFFTAGFDPDPMLEPACVDPRRREFLTALLDTPDYHALHAATRLDDTAASIAAVHFAEQFAQLAKEDTRPEADGATGSPVDDVGREVAAMRAVARAVTEAHREVGELHDAAAALGLGPGEPGANDPSAIAALYRRVRADPALRRVCELAGRFRRVAQSRQRTTTSHGLDDVVGVELGGDVGRLLPSELVKLAVPELELDALRRIAERQAQCREHHAVEPVGKGPVIIAIDESGSMEVRHLTA